MSNDTDLLGVAAAINAFEVGGHPESEKTNFYLLTYGSLVNNKACYPTLIK